MMLRNLYLNLFVNTHVHFPGLNDAVEGGETSIIHNVFFLKYPQTPQNLVHLPKMFGINFV